MVGAVARARAEGLRVLVGRALLTRKSFRAVTWASRGLFPTRWLQTLGS